MSNSVLDTISARRSHRAYRDTPVSPEHIDLLLKAFLESPSAVNKQPWHISVVRSQKLLDDMNEAIRGEVMKREAAVRSPRFADSAFHVFYHAPLVFFLSADPAWRYSALDSGIAVENIALAAESLGLGSVILGMPRDAFISERGEEFKKALDFKDGEEFMIAIAVGHPADDKPAHPIQEGHISYID
ncbi:MAG: nitroreductase family protein [Clostridia bacterium]|nr:nitroreductase family protein [Clostridia bacterium]